jgi:hypothetical protein
MNISFQHDFFLAMVSFFGGITNCDTISLVLFMMVQVLGQTIKR